MLLIAMRNVSENSYSVDYIKKFSIHHRHFLHTLKYLMDEYPTLYIAARKQVTSLELFYVFFSAPPHTQKKRTFFSVLVHPKVSNIYSRWQTMFTHVKHYFHLRKNDSDPGNLRNYSADLVKYLNVSKSF